VQAGQLVARDLRQRVAGDEEDGTTLERGERTAARPSGNDSPLAMTTAAAPDGNVAEEMRTAVS
jgi:hypothetical protein